MLAPIISGDGDLRCVRRMPELIKSELYNTIVLPVAFWLPTLQQEQLHVMEMRMLHCCTGGTT